MNVLHAMNVLHSFSIKNIFYDKMNLRLLFLCDELLLSFASPVKHLYWSFILRK